LSVLQYAVEVLKVKHIIVCGHYGCGGVKAAMGNQSLGIIDNWLKEIKDIYRMNKSEVDSITDEKERFNKMVEVNVREQVINLAKTSIIQHAWKNGHKPYLHGWVYGLADGIIKPVCELNSDSDELNSDSEIDSLYRYENL